MLSTTMNKGFQLTFENKLTISVQFGSGNYCENRSLAKTFANELEQLVTESEDAEIAIWDEKQNDFNFGHDKVKGYISANEVAEWIHKVANATDLESITK